MQAYIRTYYTCNPIYPPQGRGERKDIYAKLVGEDQKDDLDEQRKNVYMSDEEHKRCG